MDFTLQISQQETNTRLKQIQKSTKHVNNIIESVKKIIYNQQSLSKQQKQKLQIKICIENDKLKSSFYYIDRDEEERFRMQMMNKRRENQEEQRNSQQMRDSFRQSEKRVEFQSPQVAKWNKEKSSDNKFSHSINAGDKVRENEINQLLNDIDQISRTKITISRMINANNQIDSLNKRNEQKIKINNQPAFRMSYYSQSKDDTNKNKTVQNITVQSGNRNRNTVVTTSSRVQPSSNIKQSRYIINNQNQLYINKNKHLHNKPNYYEYSVLDKNKFDCQQNRIQIKTPVQQIMIVNKQFSPASIKINQSRNQQPDSSYINVNTTSTYKKTSPKTQFTLTKSKRSNQEEKQFASTAYPSYHEEFQFQHSRNDKIKDIVDPLSFSYKDIITYNKQRLNQTQRVSTTTRQHNSNAKQTNKLQYKLYIEQLLEKKQKNKQRLYGKSISRQKSQLNSPRSNVGKSFLKSSVNNSQISAKQQPSNKKYIIGGGSHKKSSHPQVYDNQPDQNSSRSRRSSQFTHTQHNRPLHTSTIKSYHINGCGNDCMRCKSTSIPSRQELSEYHLVKKYLTPQGQQECYNFLRSQGIQQKDWGIFVMEYVYRQLSKTYQERSLEATRFVDSSRRQQEQQRDKCKLLQRDRSQA